MSIITDYIINPCTKARKHHRNARRQQADMEARVYCFIRDDKLYVNEVSPYTVSLTGDTDMAHHVLSFADAMSMVEWYRKKFLEVHYPDLAKEHQND